MTGTIWKYVLEAAEEQTVELKKGAKIISAGWDPKTGFCVWAEIPDKTAAAEKVTVLSTGTGHDLPEKRGRFIGTAIALDTGLVFHFYEGAGY